MLVIHAYLKSKTNRQAEFLELLHDLVDKSRDENGCVTFGLFADTRVVGSFIVIEEWVDADCLAHHHQSTHFLHFQSRINELLDGTPEVTTYTGL